MKTQPLISIIIPVYNTEAYLPKCLESVYGQSYQNLEIILVDDGSPDNAAIILEAYAQKDSRIKVIYQENAGVSKARNTGLEVASGKYVMFLDSDDWIDFDTCEKAINSAQDEQADVVIWSFCREYVCNSIKTLVFGSQTRVFLAGDPDFPYRQVVGPIGKELLKPQQLDRSVTAWGKLYRRDLIGDKRFVDTRIIGTEDCLFNVEVLALAKRIAYIPDTMNHYRKDNISSLTHGYDSMLADKWLENYRRITLHLVKTNAPNIYYQALNNRICFGLIGGIGMRIIADRKLTRVEKKKHLRHVLNMPHYQKALKKLPMKQLRVRWRVFFFFAKHKCIEGLYFLLLCMNKFRRIV